MRRTTRSRSCGRSSSTRVTRLPKASRCSLRTAGCGSIWMLCSKAASGAREVARGQVQLLVRMRYLATVAIQRLVLHGVARGAHAATVVQIQFHQREVARCQPVGGTRGRGGQLRRAPPTAIVWRIGAVLAFLFDACGRQCRSAAPCGCSKLLLGRGAERLAPDPTSAWLIALH